MNTLYFDYAATTPTDPEVVEAMKPYYSEVFGNASSPHSIGQKAHKTLEDARDQLARFIGANPQEIIFTGSATESNNHALLGMADALKDKGRHIIISSIEHHSIFEPAEYLMAQGYEITYLPVESSGLINPLSVKKAITDQTILVAIIHANNEIGTIQPIAEISKITEEKNIPLLVDAVQSVGRIPIDVNDLGVDVLSCSAHKLYGPKGIGALYIRKNTKISKFLRGGDQERDQRASTQNVVGAVGFARAIAICQEKMAQEAKVQIQLRDKLIEDVLKNCDGVQLNGDKERRLPNNAHFSFQGIDGQALLVNLDMAGICASMGSACTSGSMQPSRILKSIGLSDELARGSLRITIGRWTTSEHIDILSEQIKKNLNLLRK